MNPFAGLHPSLQHHIVNSLRWTGLRPLQAAAVEPITAGRDALLLAPTAAGKTEAAIFPLLTRMAAERWTDVSLLYLCPLKALLNNLEGRLADYAEWVGRSAALWHGDVDAARRRQIQIGRPDVLLTTPESLESMLVSEHVDAATFLSGVRAVVVDEVHAFAGDDRGWHLLAVVARLEHLLGRQLQRVGMSATIGNPQELLGWLQGRPFAGPDLERGTVIAPDVGEKTAVPSSGAPPVDVTVDHVGSLENAATVIAALHRGEKRLVFVDSRRYAEELGQALRTRGVTTYLSHSSLSLSQRRESERAFAEARDCVIIATSTLELGVDIGDLDRVIQIDAPRSVASFLQRLGRTGRRAGTSRNCLFLCLSPESTLLTTSVVLRWKQGWVEPVTAPPHPHHIVAQQLLAEALAGHGFPLARWSEPWGGLPLMDRVGEDILEHLLDQGFLDQDGGTAFVGPSAERRFGRRHFMGLLSVFTSPPQFTVVAGRSEIGSVGIEVLTEDRPDGRRLLLGGRSWQVTHVDWTRHRCFVEPAAGGGRARWASLSPSLSFTLATGMRDVVLGADVPGVVFTERATTAIRSLRADLAGVVHRDGPVLQRTTKGDWRWWTWAGMRTNRTLLAWLPDLVDSSQRLGEIWLRLHRDLTLDGIRERLTAARDQQHFSDLPAVDDQAIRGLKFSDALPYHLAVQTLALRLADPLSARQVLDTGLAAVVQS
ncbi:DEAD/DEAH box helicase [Nakamurella endophytica]|uniref:ATP-dependent helicase n=1 Tax=Nakamurella endophytica TaxID=1748367 RepID=A0A917SWH1_9ACTN|nr:DEAD/DEAH box helicase [Nakamurella endophytica]GGL99839.1 ATP-dependent helicase [Nakamurella endophytica]